MGTHSGSGARPGAFARSYRAGLPTIPRSNDNKDVMILPGTLPFLYRKTRGMSADFVLLLGDRRLRNSPASEGLTVPGVLLGVPQASVPAVRWPAVSLPGEPGRRGRRRSHHAGGHGQAQAHD